MVDMVRIASFNTPVVQYSVVEDSYCTRAKSLYCTPVSSWFLLPLGPEHPVEKSLSKNKNIASINVDTKSTFRY